MRFLISVTVPKNLKGGVDPLGFVKLLLVANYGKKLKGGPFGDLEIFPTKKFNEICEQCHSAKTCKRGDPLGFFAIQCVAKYRNKCREPLVKSKKFQKSRIVPKKSLGAKGGSLVCFRGSGRLFRFGRAPSEVRVF